MRLYYEKQKRHLLWALTICFMALLMHVHVASDKSNGEIQLSMTGLRVVAEQVRDCTGFGYRTWDSPISSSSGYDCLCVARHQVRNSC